MYRTLVLALWGLALGLSFSCLGDTDERLAMGFCGKWNADPRAVVSALKGKDTDAWDDWAETVPEVDTPTAKACREALNQYFEEASFLLPALESFEERTSLRESVEADAAPPADEFGHLIVEVEDYGHVTVAKSTPESSETAALQQAHAREVQYHKAWENLLARLIVRLGRGDL